MNIASEVALILDCTTIRPGPGVAARIRSRAEDGPDWTVVLEMAIPHGVLPLVAHNLLEHASSAIPDEMRIQLRSLLERTGERNARHCSALDSVMSALAEEKIPALAFKGPTLAASAYGDWTLREFHDLDIWTKGEDLARAGALLRRVSFQPAAYKDGCPIPFRDDLCDRHTQFMSEDGTVIVELQDMEQASHFHFKPEFQDLWQRRVQVAVAGFEFPTLCPEDLLLVLAAHGSKHAWRRLSWIIDVAGLIESNPSLDWNAIFLRAGQWRCQRRLLATLALAVRLYGPPIPLLVEEAIAGDLHVRQLVSRYIKNTLRVQPRGGRRRKLGRMTSAVSKSMSEIAHHCLFTDRTADRLSVFSSEVARRMRWAMIAVRER